MARDWSELETLAALERRLETLAPGNVAELPIAAAKQRTITGEYGWVVDIHVKIPGVTEYEVTGAGKTYAGALRRAYLGLNNETNLRRHAARANATFGIAVA